MSHPLTPKRRLAIAKNGLADSAAGTLDAAGFTAIFSMFLNPVLHQFLESIGKYFLFPISILAHGIKTILAWRQVYLDKGSQRSIASAVVETLGAMAITAAVVGSLAASAMFALATPLLFTITLAGKTLYQAISAIYYAVKAVFATDPKEKQQYKTLAVNSAIGAAAGLVATAATVMVFLLGKIAYAAIGVVGGVAGGVLAVLKGYKMYKEAQQVKAEVSDASIANHPSFRSSMTTVAGLFTRLRAPRANTAYRAAASAKVRVHQSIAAPKYRSELFPAKQPLLLTNTPAASIRYT